MNNKVLLRQDFGEIYFSHLPIGSYLIVVETDKSKFSHTFIKD